MTDTKETRALEWLSNLKNPNNRGTHGGIHKTIMGEYRVGMTCSTLSDVLKEYYLLSKNLFIHKEALRQALQSRAGQECETKKTCPKCYSDNWSVEGGCAGGSWADGGECANREDPYVPPSKSDAVDVEGLKKETVSTLLKKEVESVKARYLQQNFSFNKAQGEFEYFTRLVVDHLNAQGHLTPLTERMNDE